MIDTYEEYDEDLIPLPRMSEFLLDEFMIPMNLTANEVSQGTGIPLYDVRSILADTQEITPDVSEKLGAYFNVSPMLFYNIQQDLAQRERAQMLEYA